MWIVYASRTGNVERFVQQLPPWPRLRLRSGEEHLEEPFVLVTYTTGFGEVPPEVWRFAQAHRSWVRGVAASGNRSWGSHFARAADRLAAALEVPLLHKFELSGWPGDVQAFIKGVNDLALP